MAWTFFTDWLEPGQQITLEQRNELIDAFAERCNVAGAFAGNRFEFISSPEGDILSDKVVIYDAVESRIRQFRLWQAINRIAIRFFIGLSGRAQWGISGSVRPIYQACIDLGLADDSAITSSPPFNSALYWNVCRRAIQLLRYPVVGIFRTYLELKTGQGLSFQDALNNLVSQSYGNGAALDGKAESLGYWLNEGNGVTNFARAWRAYADCPIPPALTDFDLRVWVYIQRPVGIPISLPKASESKYTIWFRDFGLSVSKETPEVTSGTEYLTFDFIGDEESKAFTGASGPLALEIEPTAAHDSTAWAGKPASGVTEGAEAVADIAAAIPDFTHPYEELE